MDEEFLQSEGIPQTSLIEEIDAGNYLVDPMLDIDGKPVCDGDEEYNEIEVNDDPITEEEQILGKEFDSPTEVYEFYNRYALLHGFGIRTHYAHKTRATNEIFRRQYICNKEGFKNLNDKKQLGTEKKHRRDSRTGCEAMLRVTKQVEGKWVVDIFRDVHNHELIATPTKVMKHRSHARVHLSAACRSLVIQLSENGMRPCQIIKLVNVVNPSQAKITSRHVSDILSKERKSTVGRECHALVKHLQHKASSDSTFYFAMDLTENGCLKTIFWADGRSRESFTQFVDILIFDVTYMTNKFKMPFAPFVGVNHHRQSILFGAALLTDETEPTFTWLFSQFLKCMFGKAPVAIITDQDGAMHKAISTVFPKNRHRFCAWHIRKHVMEHLQPLRARYNDFQASYTKWVKSETTEEFEEQWKNLLERYEIAEDSWLVKLYKLHKYWAKAFLKDTFFAGMTTSGRSESIHSFFDGYVNSNTMLNEFILQYDKAVDARRSAEEDEDFRTMNTKPVLSSVHPIEIQAGESYTRCLFEIFKKQWVAASNNCTHEKISKSSEYVVYKVGLINLERERWRTVKFTLLGEFNATCSCAMFEIYGILCKHILYVMKKKNIKVIPDFYVLSRWTISARYKMSNNSVLDDLNTDNGSLAIWSVQANCNKAIEEARDSHSEMKRLNSFLVEFVKEQVIRKKKIHMEDESGKGSCVDSAQVATYTST